jgi:hypothetical protein
MTVEKRWMIHSGTLTKAKRNKAKQVHLTKAKRTKAKRTKAKHKLGST